MSDNKSSRLELLDSLLNIFIMFSLIWSIRNMEGYLKEISEDLKNCKIEVKANENGQRVIDRRTN